MPTAVIRLHAYNPTILTTEEFEALETEVTARIVAGIAGISDRVLATMIHDNKWRYVEAKEHNEAKGHEPEGG